MVFFNTVKARINPPGHQLNFKATSRPNYPMSNLISYNVDKDVNEKLFPLTYREKNYLQNSYFLIKVFHRNLWINCKILNYKNRHGVIMVTSCLEIQRISREIDADFNGNTMLFIGVIWSLKRVMQKLSKKIVRNFSVQI